MAAKRLYLVDAAAAGSNHGSLQDGGAAPAGARTVTGIINGQTTATKYQIQDYGVERANTWAATSYIDAGTAINNTVGDCWRSEDPITGSFANAAWAVSLQARGESRATSTTGGSFKFRLWKGADATGSGATSIAVGQTTSFSALANSAAQTVTASVSPGALSLSGEYLFLQIEFVLSTAGNNNAADIHLCVGSSCTVTTSDFTAPSQTMAVDPAAASPAAMAPVLVSEQSAQDLVAPAAAAAPAAADPALQPGGAALAPAPAQALPSPANPALQPGGAALVAPAAAAAPAAADPAMESSSPQQQMVLDSPAAVVEAAALAMSPGPAWLAAAAAAAAPAAVAAVLVAGAAAMALGAAAASPAAADPAMESAAAALVAPAAAASPAAADPTLRPGEAALEPAPAQAQPEAMEPALEPGGAALVAPAASVLPRAVAPRMVSGELPAQALPMSVVSAQPAAADPALQPGAAALAMPVVSVLLRSYLSLAAGPASIGMPAPGCNPLPAALELAHGGEQELQLMPVLPGACDPEPSALAWGVFGDAHIALSATPAVRVRISSEDASSAALALSAAPAVRVRISSDDASSAALALSAAPAVRISISITCEATS